MRNGLPPLFRLGQIDMLLYWSTTFIFRIMCLLTPLLYLLFDWRIFTVSAADGVAHFCPMILTNIVLMFWISHGRVLPVVSDLYGALISLQISKVVALVLIKRKDYKFKVTAKGIQSDRTTVQWRLLIGSAVLIAVMVVAISSFYLFHHSDPIADGTAISVFWCWYNAVVLLLCCMMAIERPKRRRDERFIVREPVTVHGPGFVQPCRTIDVSVGGLRIDKWISGEPGSPVTVDLGGDQVNAIIVRKDNGGVALHLADEKGRETMIRYIFTDHRCPQIDDVHIGKLAYAMVKKVVG